MVRKLISGGQTGVDRAALDVALELGIPCGGWCPKGRKAEDGEIPARYPLQEMPSAEYAVRTEWNVRDSDATLVLCYGMPSGGTALTIGLARRHRKPLLIIDFNLKEGMSPADVREWVERRRVGILNVAGPRASTDGRGYSSARAFLRLTLSPLP